MPRDPRIRDRWLAGCRHLTGRPIHVSPPVPRAPASRSAIPPKPTVWAAVLALSLFLAARPAFAGPNQGGVLLLHCNQTLEFTTDRDFSGYAGLYDGNNAVTQVPGEGQGVVYFVLAAFDDFAMPRLKSIAFGLALSSPTVEPIRWGPTGETNVVIPVGSWPSSGSGVMISWAEPFNRRINEIYWFGGYASAGQTVKLVQCPGQAGVMADDSFPAEVDEIAGYGILGFGVKGFNPLSDEATGACCAPDETCALTIPVDCASPAIWHSEFAVCDPTPCRKPEPTELTSWGQIKNRYR